MHMEGAVKIRRPVAISAGASEPHHVRLPVLSATFVLTRVRSAVVGPAVSQSFVELRDDTETKFLFTGFDNGVFDVRGTITDYNRDAFITLSSRSAYDSSRMSEAVTSIISFAESQFAAMLQRNAAAAAEADARRRAPISVESDSKYRRTEGDYARSDDWHGSWSNSYRDNTGYVPRGMSRRPTSDCDYAGITYPDSSRNSPHNPGASASTPIMDAYRSWRPVDRPSDHSRRTGIAATLESEPAALVTRQSNTATLNKRRRSEANLDAPPIRQPRRMEERAADRFAESDVGSRALREPLVDRAPSTMEGAPEREPDNTPCKPTVTVPGIIKCHHKWGVLTQLNSMHMKLAKACQTCGTRFGHFSNPIAALMFLHGLVHEDKHNRDVRAATHVSIDCRLAADSEANDVWQSELSLSTLPASSASPRLIMQCLASMSMPDTPIRTLVLQHLHEHSVLPIVQCSGVRENAKISSHSVWNPWFSSVEVNNVHTQTDASSSAACAPQAQASSASTVEDRDVGYVPVPDELPEYTNEAQTEYVWVNGCQVQKLRPLTNAGFRHFPCFLQYLTGVTQAEAEQHSVCRECRRCHLCRGKGHQCHEKGCACRHCNSWSKIYEARDSTKKIIAAEQDSLLAATAAQMKEELKRIRANSLPKATMSGDTPDGFVSSGGYREVNIAALPVPDADALASTDPYIVIGVPYFTDMSSIRKRFHQLALLFHPDKAQGTVRVQTSSESKAALDIFLRISQAYEEINRSRSVPGTGGS